MTKFFLVIAMIIFSAALLLGCGTKTIEDITGNKQLERNQSFKHEETKENINFKIKVNQKNFNSEDEIVVDASATNVGNKSVAYDAGSSTCVSHIRIQIVSKDNSRHLVIKPPKEIRVCTDDIHIEQLEPQETVQEKIVFLPKEQIQSSEVPASGGTYNIVVWFRPEGSNWENAINVKTEIGIAGTNKDLISKEKVEQIANNNKEVQKWIENHSGEKVAKIENGKCFLLWYDGWHITNKQEFEKMKQGVYQEEKQVQFVAGKWEVSYLSKLGPSPNRIKIIVDANSGEISSVKTFER